MSAMGKRHFDETWPVMRLTILKLLHQEPVSRNEWQDLFWLVHSLCFWTEKGPSRVYDSLKDDISAFIKQVKIRVLTHQEDQALLRAYISEWRKFFTQCNYLPLLFGQLDTTLCINSYIMKTRPTNESIVRELMLRCWIDCIFYDIKYRLQNSFMKLICRERNGEAFDSQLVIGLTESYVNLCPNDDLSLQIYRKKFKWDYIETTEAFYQAKASQYLEVNGVQNYMHYAEQKLKEEEQRATKYLGSYIGSVQSIVECCAGVLIIVFKDIILAEYHEMIKNNEIEGLQLMFKFMDRAPGGIPSILKDLELHIVNHGLADMYASAEIITQDSEKYVEQLLELFARFSRLVREAFNDDPRFLKSRDKGFMQVVNDTSVFPLALPLKDNVYSINTRPESRCPELLANYCDLLLRKTLLSKKLTSDEIEGKLKEVLLVLKYVQNKDVFMWYYKAHLTHRLILNSSADSEKEENMVKWFRDEGMPADYINKLARMFQDIKVSEDLNQQFKSTHGSLADLINIKILNARAWTRDREQVQVSLPVEIEHFVPKTEEFYRQKPNGRKLQWYNHMSNGTITFTNAVGKYDLDVTIFQMAVLFAWNQRANDKISYEKLMLTTELPDAELRRTLWSLIAFPKLKRQVLLFEPDMKSSKDFDDSTMFWVNRDFCVTKSGKPQKRGKVNLIGHLQLCTEKSKEEVSENIMQLRILMTQGAILKIVKMRKKIANTQLRRELLELLENAFLPSNKMIKEQTEWLIRFKYIKRDEKNIKLLVCIA